MDKESFTYIIFTLLNNEYQLILKTFDNFNVDLGKYSFEQVEHLTGPLLCVTSLCIDVNDYDMVYDDELIYNDRIRQANPLLRNILLIRRGIWEMIYTL